jgi:predicted RNase H-like HicB family nuclease
LYLAFYHLIYLTICLSYLFFIPKYSISIYPEEEGGYTAMIPDLPGCMTQGETLEEVVMNIEESRQLWIETVYLSNKKDIPRPSRKI